MPSPCGLGVASPEQAPVTLSVTCPRHKSTDHPGPTPGDSSCLSFAVTCCASPTPGDLTRGHLVLHTASCALSQLQAPPMCQHLVQLSPTSRPSAAASRLLSLLPWASH